MQLSKFFRISQAAVGLTALAFFACLCPEILRAEGPIYVARIEDATVNPITAEYILQSITAAEKGGAECLVIELDTPGGLLSSTHLIVKGILSAQIPIIVYVAPGGSRAGSAGVFITYASHIAAMAPSTRIGAAHPVSMGEKQRTIWDAVRDLIDRLSRAKDPGQKKKQEEPQPEEGVMETKILQDSVAYIRSIAEQRNRNAEWAVKSVTESASITEVEALKLKVVEVIASDKSELADKIDGMKVLIKDQEKVLNTRQPQFLDLDMTLRQKILNVLANPNIAYFLLILGFYGLLFEVTHPGIGAPGIVGVIFLILAFYSFQLLPTNYAGLALLILGILLLAAELFVPGFGLPTLGGILCMVMGSLLLFESRYELMRVSTTLVLSVTAATAFITFFLLRAVLKAHRRKAKSGPESMIGLKGVAQSEIGPAQAGKVFIRGELWNAKSSQSIQTGEAVRVLGMDAMTVVVEKTET